MEIDIINTQDEFDKKAYNIFNNIHRYYLSNAIVNCDLEFFKSETSNNSVRFEFDNVEFIGLLKFNQKLSFTLFDINSCIFKSSLKLRNQIFQDCIILNSTFEKKVDFSGSSYARKMTVSGNKFFSEAALYNCIYDSNIRIEGNEFLNQVFFVENIFNGESSFNDNSFMEGVDFSGSTFKNKFMAWGISGYENKVDFERVIFTKDSFLTQSQFYGGISLYASTIKESLDLTGIKVFGKNTDSNTLRIIKAFFLKQNNRIQVLKFHEKLMTAHENELRDNYIKSRKELLELKRKNRSSQNDSLIAEYKEIIKDYERDYLILTLNRLSNNYGLSWTRAFWFIIISSIVFYSLYVLSFIILGNYPYKFGWNGWIEFWNGAGYTSKYYLQFLWPTHRFDFMIGVKSSFFSYLIDILARITIGFGIFQMIQAFRKFGKI